MEPARFEERPEALTQNRSVWTRFKRGVGEIQTGFQLPENQLFLLLAVIIGIFSGLTVVCFRIAFEWIRLALLGSALKPPAARVLIVPALAGLVVAFLVKRFFPLVRGSGVNQTKSALYISDGYIPFQTVIGKFLTCALAIGGGHSLGPEDPSLQMGAGLASAMGRQLRLSRDKIRLIAPIGAAAGLAAAFNAPIAAVLFVIEEVIGTWSAGVLGAIVLSAVSSVVVVRWFLGSEPLFRIPPYQLAHPAELIGYALLGLIAGLASLVLVKLVSSARLRLKDLPGWTQYFQPAAAGLLIGVIALWLPQVMGAGYESIDQAMHGQFDWKLLALLGVFKILATGLSFASGTPGGLFAPTLFVGAMFGGTVGALEAHFFPHLTASVGMYALVGMGALFAGFLRAPMTSVFMILEVSGSYSIILPVMISNTLAYLISRHYQEVPLMDLLSRQDGLELPSMEELREKPVLRVEDAMRPVLHPPLVGRNSLADCLKRIEHSPSDFFLVRLEDGTWSGVTRKALERWEREGNGSAPVESLLSPMRLERVHPDESLDTALRRIADSPLLPVVARTDPAPLLGILSLSDILGAYKESPPA